MGIMDRARTRLTSTSVTPTDSKDYVDESLHTTSDRDSDSLSLEARNEKEIHDNPDNVTANAALGVKKAEAAALVWSKKAVYLTYAW